MTPTYFTFIFVFCLILQHGIAYSQDALPPDTKIVLQRHQYTSVGEVSGYWILYADGKVEFGELAEHIDHVPVVQITDLVNSFKAIDFLALEDKDLVCRDGYYSTHDPNVSIELTMDGRSKKVSYIQVPECDTATLSKVNVLIDKITRVIESTSWVKEMRRKTLESQGLH